MTNEYYTMFQMFQQLAGVNTVMYYSATIVSMAGVTDDTQAIWLEYLFRALEGKKIKSVF